MLAKLIYSDDFCLSHLATVGKKTGWLKEDFIVLPALLSITDTDKALGNKTKTNVNAF